MKIEVCFASYLPDWYTRGLSPTEYTNMALSFYDDYQSLLRPNYSDKYNMMRYIHKNKIGVGYYDELGYIIDFIVRGDL